MSNRRFGGLTAIFFVVLLVTSSFFLPEGPSDETATPEQITSFYGQNETTLAIGISLSIISWGFFIWFLGSLRDVLSQTESSSDQLSTIAFGSGLLTAGLFLASSALSSMPLLVDLGRADSPTVWYSIAGTSEALGDVTTVTRGVMALAVSWLAIRHGVFSKWLGWSGMIISVLSLVGSGFPIIGGPFGLVWFLGYALFLLWVLVIGVVLVGRPAGESRGVAD